MRGDSTRAREVLAWKPRVNLEEGLKITIDWFRDQIARGNPVICNT
jgi:nucleoside-diphosphate-sugar epimerase